jgi:hypothetical protein
MTEAEWLTSNDPAAMLRSLIARYSAQKRRGETPNFERLRLFACGCCRRVWDVLDNDHRRSVELIEEYVRTRARNGLIAARRARRAASNQASFDYDRLTRASPRDRRACLVGWARVIASSAVWQAADKLPTKAAYSCLQVAEAVHSIRLAEGASANGPDPGYIGYKLPSGGELPFQAALLRELVGNPFARKSEAGAER